MARVKLTLPEQCPWLTMSNAPPTDETRAKLAEGELSSEFKLREAGSELTPQLVELRYPPNAEIRLHAHDEDEIMYVLEGAMRINSRTVGPGACLYIAGHTFYGFHAGPEGLHLLNFRPRKDASFHLPER
jgi:mannose-6-phosphate isomerase-like protein (cupin superfamily)